MVEKIKMAFIAPRKGKKDIMAVKKAKMYETESYLAAQRHLQPNAPIGFKPRSSASYYLTSHHF